MVRPVSFAVTQFACGEHATGNADRAEEIVRRAASAGANVVLLQELFETPYFCKVERPGFFDHASPFEGNRLIARFA